MIDLAINRKGDLIFTTVEKKVSPLTISFLQCEQSGMKISFKIIDNPRLKREESSLKISFNVEDKKDSLSALTIKENKAKVQNLEIRLRTELGELANRPQIGSLLKKYKHENLHSEKVLADIQAAVVEAITHLIPYPEVRVKPIIYKTERYKQTVQINIFENGYLIFKYDI